MDIQWEVPPPATRGRSAAPDPIAEALRKNPGEWARIAVKDKQATANSLAVTIKRGTRKGFGPAGSFESVTRSLDGKGIVYARFVGQD